MSKFICPDCVSYEHCKEMGYADAERCVNFEKRTDFFDIRPLFEAAKHNMYAEGKIDIKDSSSNTLQIDKCKRIIFRDRTLDFVFELSESHYKDIDIIIINGIKFKKTE